MISYTWFKHTIGLKWSENDGISEIRPIRKSTRGGAIFKNGYRPAGKPTRGGAIFKIGYRPALKSTRGNFIYWT